MLPINPQNGVRNSPPVSPLIVSWRMHRVTSTSTAMLWLPSDWELTGTHVSGEKWVQLVSWTTSKMWKERSVLVEQDSESMYCKKKYNVSIKDSFSPTFFLGGSYYPVLHLPISIITSGVSVHPLALSSNKCCLSDMLECRELPLHWRENVIVPWKSFTTLDFQEVSWLQLFGVKWTFSLDCTWHYTVWYQTHL